MLVLTPIHIRDANEFVRQYHRHHKPVTGAKFALAAAAAGVIVAVAIVGRPVSRLEDDGYTLEVVRLCSNGTRNACSFLYGRCWRAVQALGYKRLLTYTLPQEGGASLRAAGYRCLGPAGGGSWNAPSRPRIDKHPLQTKLKWSKETTD